MNFTAKKTKTTIELSLKEIENEAQYFLNKAQIQIEKDIASGLTLKAATDKMIDEIKNNEGLFKTFTNTQTKIIDVMSNELVAKPIEDYAQENPEQLFEWVLGSVKTSHCADCEKLSNMEPRTVDEWRAEGYGLPREGETLCSVGCRCLLRAVK